MPHDFSKGGIKESRRLFVLWPGTGILSKSLSKIFQSPIFSVKSVLSKLLHRSAGKVTPAISWVDPRPARKKKGGVPKDVVAAFKLHR